MSKKDSKLNLLSHSEAKVRLLGEYLKRYLNIIANDKYTKRIKVYDLFCGEGIYKNGGEGSPLVILRQIKDMHFTNVARPANVPKIDCHFNDLNKAKIEKVANVVAERSLHYAEFGEIDFTSNNYDVELKTLVSTLPKLKSRNEKTFIFIDPYEYRHIKASQIKALMAQGCAEVLLWLPTQFMYRFAENGTPESLKDFIDELDLFKKWNPSNSVWDFVNQLKEGFQAYLGGNVYVDNFTIQKDPNTVFCLFFFTSHIRGFEKMLETKWEIDTEQGKGWNYTGNQPTLFHAQKTGPLEEKLLKFLQDGKRYNYELYEFILRQGFLPKHANEVFYNWQIIGKLDVVSMAGTKVRKGAFYITYQNYKERKKIVTFQLK